MKTLTKLISAAAIAAGSIGATTMASAEVSYNVGYVSEYYYRGFFQAKSSASAGIDYEESGFYVGAWTADVDDGLEYDLYAGYGMDIGEVSVGVGFTGYYYTEDSFDDTYEEVNLSVGYGPVSVGYSFGEWDGAGGQDYDFIDVSIDLGAGFYGTYGDFGDEFDGSYFELGYGTTVSEIDLGITLIFPDSDIEEAQTASGAWSGDAVVFSLGKSF
jgi:uncharacterized protein (TIGR02001 family)